jgi:hypothetical protein
MVGMPLESKARRETGRSPKIAGAKHHGRRALLLEAIRHPPVVTRAYFNPPGEFDFSDERMADSMGWAISLIPAKFNTLSIIEVSDCSQSTWPFPRARYLFDLRAAPKSG